MDRLDFHLRYLRHPYWTVIRLCKEAFEARRTSDAEILFAYHRTMLAETIVDRKNLHTTEMAFQLWNLCKVPMWLVQHFYDLRLGSSILIPMLAELHLDLLYELTDPQNAHLHDIVCSCLSQSLKRPLDEIKKDIATSYEFAVTTEEHNREYDFLRPIAKKQQKLRETRERVEECRKRTAHDSTTESRKRVAQEEARKYIAVTPSLLPPPPPNIARPPIHCYISPYQPK